MYRKCAKIYKRIVRHMNLFLIWWCRIVFANNHFNVPFLKRFKYNLKGYMADQVVLYDLKHHKGEYLSEFDWYKSRYINEPYNFILNNKMVCNKLLEPYAKVPTIYAFKDHKIIGFENDIDSVDKILALIKEKKNIYLKPISEGKGNGVNMLSYDGKSYLLNEKKCKKEAIIELLEKQNNWFLSGAIKQSSFLDSIYDKTTNTIRMITLKNKDTNKFELFFAVLRIGTSKTIPVDNGSKGGLVAKIDLETGELSEAKNIHSLNVWEKHPDSANKKKGMVIPKWNKVKNVVFKLANEFPFLKFIAWDILLTDDGFCVIEANTSSGVNIIQIWGPQRNKELGDFYRQYNVIK